MPRPADEAVRRRMQRQRRRDTSREIAIRRQLHALGYRFRVDFRLAPPLRTRADIVFTRQKVAVFVDGCFWHGCPEHRTQPKNNAEWWQQKLQSNVDRDRRTNSELAILGWTVLRIWEHEPSEEAVDKVIAQISRNTS